MTFKLLAWFLWGKRSLQGRVPSAIARLSLGMTFMSGLSFFFSQTGNTA
ncbi:hypothetical protein [Allocoleopsis sp.]